MYCFDVSPSMRSLMVCVVRMCVVVLVCVCLRVRACLRVELSDCLCVYVVSEMARLRLACTVCVAFAGVVLSVSLIANGRVCLGVRLCSPYVCMLCVFTLRCVCV